MLIESRNFDLPESFRDTILLIIREAKDKDIIDYVEEHKEFRDGMKAVATLVHRFKDNLCKYFSTIEKINAEETQFLYENGFGLQFVAVLSFRAIEYGQEAFRAFFGNEKFLLALVLDERDEIFSLGKSILENDQSLEMTSEESETFLKDSYTPFLVHLSTLFTKEKETQELPTDNFEKEIKTLTRELNKKNRVADSLRKQIAKERDDFRAKEESAVEKVKNTAERLSLAHLELEMSNAKLSDLHLEKENIEKSIESKITLGVEERLHAISSTWFQGALQVEEEAQSMSYDMDLLARAEQAISQQAEQDHNSGNRRDLKERISRLQQANIEINDMISNAISLTPDLTSIAKDLSDEIIKLEMLLGLKNSDEYSAVAASLTQRAHACDSYEELQSIQELVQTLSEYGLTQSEAYAINDAICNKISLLIAMTDGNLESLSEQATGHLRKSLDSGEPTLIFFDGHNIINLLPQFVEPCKKDHALGRQHFIETISAYSHGYPHCQFRIIFDGPDHYREKISSQVTVEFSGGGNESQRADNYILESISWLRKQGAEVKIYLITSDKNLGREASSSGVGVIPAFHIEPLLYSQEKKVLFAGKGSV